MTLNEWRAFGSRIRRLASGLNDSNAFHVVAIFIHLGLVFAIDQSFSQPAQIRSRVGRGQPTFLGWACSAAGHHQKLAGCRLLAHVPPNSWMVFLDGLVLLRKGWPLM